MKLWGVNSEGEGCIVKVMMKVTGMGLCCPVVNWRGILEKKTRHEPTR